MKYLVLVLALSLIPFCYAEEFKSDNPIDADGLCKEIQVATGLSLQGLNQEGSMSTRQLEFSDNTSERLITIKLKDRDLTDEEKDKIGTTIKNHSIEKVEQDKEKAKQDEIKLKEHAEELERDNFKKELKDEILNELKQDKKIDAPVIE